MTAGVKAILVSALAGLLVAGCAEGVASTPPPKASFHFPVGVAVHPFGYALVVNSNFDLRYAHGSLQFVDLRTLEQRVLTGEGMASEHLDLILENPAVALPNFGGSVAVSADAERGLAAIACRQTSQVLLVDLEIEADGRLLASCGPSPAGENFVSCQGARNIIQLEEDDPFGLLLQEEEAGTGEWNGRSWSLWVSFLGSGKLDRIRLPAGRPDQGEPPQLAQEVNTGADAINDFALSPASGFIYATSRYNAYYSNPIYYFHPQEGKVRSFDLYTELLGNQTRGLAFLPDGQTLALTVRDPDVLVFLDTSLGADGMPRHTVEGLADLDNLPARVFVSDQLILVSDAESDSVSLFEADSRRLLGRREDICRGPFDFARWNGEHVSWVLVTCFEEDVLAVLDVDEQSASFLQVVARVGKPRLEEW